MFREVSKSSHPQQISQEYSNPESQKSFGKQRSEQSKTEKNDIFNAHDKIESKVASTTATHFSNFNRVLPAPKSEALSEVTLPKEADLADLKESAAKLIRLELEFEKEKGKNKKAKLPPELALVRKECYRSEHKDPQRTWNHMIRVQAAILYAWKQLPDDELCAGVAPELKEQLKGFVLFREKECLQSIATIESKKKQAVKPLQSLTFDAHGLIPVNHPKKFTCVSGEIPLPKNSSVIKQDGDPAELGKKVKQKIKSKLLEKVQSEMVNKSAEYGPTSRPIKIALEDFALQLKKCQLEDLTFDTQFAVLNDTCSLFDVYCKSNGILCKDPVMRDFYSELSRKLPNSHELNLYQYTEEFYRKKFPCDTTPMQHAIDQRIAIRLQNILERVVGHLEKKMEEAKISETNLRQEFSVSEIESVVALVTNYLTKLIKIHKQLSYNRFIDLFSLHSRFLNRLHFAINKVQPFYGEIQGIIASVLSPEVTLLETKRHRVTQARHEWNEPAKDRKHYNLEEINQYIRFLTLGDTYDMLSFECAHVIPFPALFARRDHDANNDSLLRKTKLKSAQVSSQYLQAEPSARDEMFIKDIEILHEQLRDKPMEFIDSALEVILKLSLEEASQTVHIPSVFNQEVDAVSEKYIPLLKENSEAGQLHAKNHEFNIRQKAKGDSAAQHYTEKVYKYMLGTSLFSMIQEQKTFAYSEVMAHEDQYIYGVKIALSRRIEWLVHQPQTLTNLLIAVAMCNVFFGLKNAESLGNLNLKAGDTAVDASFKKLEHWVEK